MDFLNIQTIRDLEVAMRRLALIASQRYAGRDWHKLTKTERADVAWLEASGLIVPNEPNNGFVGKISAELDLDYQVPADA
jgi:hypothetical protein